MVDSELPHPRDGFPAADFCAGVDPSELGGVRAQPPAMRCADRGDASAPRRDASATTQSGPEHYAATTMVLTVAVTSSVTSTTTMYVPTCRIGSSR